MPGPTRALLMHIGPILDPLEIPTVAALGVILPGVVQEDVPVYPAGRRVDPDGHGFPW